MKGTPIIRPASGADLDSIIALDQRITGRSRRGFYVKRFAAQQDDAKGFAWLTAVSGETVVGFVSAHLQDGEFGAAAPVAVIDAIGTAPEVRGGGVARLLMEALTGNLRNRGVTEIHTEADWMEHELVHFFASAGFQLAPDLVLECDVTSDL